jgi:hypothetical protein
VRRVRDPDRAPPPPPPDLPAPASPSSSKPRSGIPSAPSFHPAWSRLPSCGVRGDRRRPPPCHLPRHTAMPELRGFEEEDLLDDEGPLSVHVATPVALSTPLHTPAAAGSPSTSVPLPVVPGPTSPPPLGAGRRSPLLSSTARPFYPGESSTGRHGDLLGDEDGEAELDLVDCEFSPTPSSPFPRPTSYRDAAVQHPPPHVLRRRLRRTTTCRHRSRSLLSAPSWCNLLVVRVVTASVLVGGAATHPLHHIGHPSPTLCATHRR